MSKRDREKKLLAKFNSGIERRKRGDLLGAIKDFQAAWKMFNSSKLASRAQLDAERAKLLVNWSSALAGSGNLPESLEKYRDAWNILGVKLASHAEFDAQRVQLLTNWGNALQHSGNLIEAIKKYQEAWDIYRVKLASPTELDATRIKLLANWGNALASSDNLTEAIKKYQEAWDIRSVKLAARVELDVDHAKLLTTWGNALRRSGNLPEAIKKYEDAWDIWVVKLAACGEFDDMRAGLLMNWGVALADSGNLPEALAKYQEAWDIFGVKLAARAELDGDRAWLLMNWGIALRHLGNLPESIEKCRDAWDIFGVKLASHADLDAERAALLMTWGNALQRSDNLPDAMAKFHDAWDIIGGKLASRAELDDERARLLMNWGNALQLSGNLPEAMAKYQAAWDIWGVKLAARAELDADRATLLTNWGIALRSSGNLPEAIKKYEDAWDIFGVKLASRAELDVDHAKLLMNFGSALAKSGNLPEAMAKFQAAWAVLDGKLAHRRDADPVSFALASIWLECWPEMADPQGWAAQVSAVLRDRLMLNDGARPPSWMPELLQIFTLFHLGWMLRSLLAGKPERLVGILSRISGWRMAQALMDEIDLAEGALPEAVERFRTCRREVHRLLRELHSLEGLGGTERTDPSGLRTLGVARPAAVQAKIDALRGDYDGAFHRMRAAQAEACRDPAYSALAGDLGFEHTALQSRLAPAQAVLLLVDMQGSDAASSLSGLLLVRRDRVQWLPSAQLGQGERYLQQFQTEFARSTGYRRGEAAAPAAATPPEAPIDPASFWPTLAGWVQARLWQPLTAAQALEGIEKLTLITQGRTHALPWELGAPALALARYPGLMLYGMRCGLLACPDNDVSERIGINACEDPKLPYARREADFVERIWQDQALRPYDYIASGVASVAAVHFAGHGSHPEAGAHRAHLQVAAGTAWTLPALLASRARPRRAFISTCVAGRTSDTEEGELYGVVAAFLQRGVREVVAATVDMNDPWMMVLAVLTEQRIRAGMSQGAALAQAKADIAAGSWEASAIHTLWAADLEADIRGILARDRTARMAQSDIKKYCLPQRSLLLDLDRWTQGQIQAWIERIVARPEDLAAATRELQPLWRSTPPEPLLGSLQHAVIAFGEPYERQ